ncbi:MAG: LuxR C-terminal-related transcriptional regulator [Pseudomonadota bacterium]
MAVVPAPDPESHSDPSGSCSGLTEDFDFGRFAGAISASSSGDEVWALIDTICDKAGVEGVCCRCFPSEAGAEQIIFFSTTSRFSPELGEALEQAPGYLDAFLHASVRTTKPFLWGDMERLLEPRSPQLHYFRDHIASFGTGVVVPVFGPLFRNGYFCYHSYEDRTVTEMDMMVLHSISQTAYLKLLDIMYKTADRERTLSGRELEAINMIARGKSNPEVAEAMSVSVNTINTLLKRIFEKLDVSDRVSAVMRAYALGYIA